MATKFLRKIILEELQKVLKEDQIGQYQMPRKSAADRLKSQAFDYYAGKIKNSNVGQLQQHLIDLGYKVMPSIPGKPQMPDGYIGWRTLKAARKVFEDPTLTADDLLGAIGRFNQIASSKLEARKGVADYLSKADAAQARLDQELQHQKDIEAAEAQGLQKSDIFQNVLSPEEKEKAMRVVPPSEYLKKESIAREIRKLLRKI